MWEEIFGNLTYDDINEYALTSKQNLLSVREYFSHLTAVIIKRLGLKDKIPQQEIIERIYHLNNYKSNDLSNIKIDDSGTWTKGNNVISKTAKEEKWVLNGKKHRVNGPAWTILKGTDTHFIWYMNGELHRVDGPAETVWRDGLKIREYWYVNDELYRRDGHAYTSWKDGVKESEY